MARGRGTGKKSGSKPTSKERSSKQDIQKRLAEAIEDARLAGIIPTKPEVGLKNEVVNPTTQAQIVLPEIVRQALQENWATPNSAKPAIIAALLEPFFKNDQVLDEHGRLVEVKPSRKLLMELAKTLRMLDKDQWERDHPVEAGKAKGGGMVNTSGVGSNGQPIVVNVQTNIAALELLNKMIDDPSICLDNAETLDQSSTSSDR